jgi:membrane associated rhomboid family serine protease
MIPLHDDNPTTIKPVVTIVFIVGCVLVFLWQLSLGPQAVQAVFALGMIPAVLFDIKQLSPELAVVPAWLTLLTSMFLHGGWMHLIGNMLYLWIFGNNIEDAMGHGRVIVFYLICGVVAAMVHALLQVSSEIPVIGASGAISGVLGAYLLLFPHARVLVLIPLGFILYTVRLPAVWVLGFWFVLQLINTLMTSTAQGGVAWGAHFGGFVAGALLIPLFSTRPVKLFAGWKR